VRAETNKEDLAMNDKEKIESYIAMCKCCLLAEAMKDCPLCRFNIGLAEQVKLADFMPLPAQPQIPLFSMSE
jgi:hypothetical protein